jgi:hypothetical protein
MTSDTPRRTLFPIVRDLPGPVEPLPAAIAAITGQPLTAVCRALQQCVADLRGLAGLNGDVSPEDALHATLHRFGYEPHRLYADAHRRPLMGQLLQAYGQAAGRAEPLIAICDSGDSFAVLGSQVAGASCSAPADLRAFVQRGELDIDEPVRFAYTVTPRRAVPVASPDHVFLEAIAGPAFALADAYDIEVHPAGWPYWNLSFPSDLTDGTPESDVTVVCGEHELLSVINDRVRLAERAGHIASSLLGRMGADPRG